MIEKTKIEVENKLISIVKHDEQDYICLTDMVRDEDGTDHIRNWMRNRNTVDLLAYGKQLITPILKVSNSTPLENKLDLIALI